MAEKDVEAIIERAVAPRRLLDHEFYLRWTRGELSIDELRAYAGQYRHFEAHLPSILSGVAARATDPGLRDAALRNLADEAGGEVTHLALFDQFLDGIGGSEAPPTPATTRLLETYDRHAGQSTAAGLCAVLAYEWQAPEVAASKADGLRRHHALDGGTVEFWDTHAGVDVDHARWLVDALTASDHDAAELEVAARDACDAWWGFLDERQAVAPAAAVR